MSAENPMHYNNIILSNILATNYIYPVDNLQPKTIHKMGNTPTSKKGDHAENGKTTID